MNNPSVRRKLLKWYDAHRRELPWREKTSPYRTWVSEIMLQQTQVATVIPYFNKFLSRFPTVEILARAKEAAVLRRWAGLGYYCRARNLHRAAKVLVKNYGGRLPSDLDALLRLPGIGPYTAAAISSIAFGRPTELIDGNVARVLTRLLNIPGSVKSPAVTTKLWEAARPLLSRRRPGDWNQALMELGARVCLPAPEAPSCGACPLRSDCAAFRLGRQDRLPEIPAKRATIRLEWQGLDIRKDGRRLLWRRSDCERLLRGHWALPETRHLKSVKAGPLIRTVTHSITHHRIRLRVHQAPSPPGRLPRDARWVSERELKSYLVSSLWLKAIKKI